MRRAVPSLFLSATVGILALAPGAASYTCLYEEGLDLAKNVAIQCFQTDLIKEVKGPDRGGNFDMKAFTSSRSKQRDTLCASSCLTSLGNFRKFVDDCSSTECKANPFPITASSQVCSVKELVSVAELAWKIGNEHWNSVIETELKSKVVSGVDYSWNCSNPPTVSSCDTWNDIREVFPTGDYDIFYACEKNQPSYYNPWYVPPPPSLCKGCAIEYSVEQVGPVCGSFCYTKKFVGNSCENGYHSLTGFKQTLQGIGGWDKDAACRKQCTDDFGGSTNNINHATRKAFVCKPEVSVEIGKLASIVDKCMAELCGADEYKKVFAGPTVGVLQESSGVGNLKSAWVVFAAWCASALAALLM